MRLHEIISKIGDVRLDYIGEEKEPLGNLLLNHQNYVQFDFGDVSALPKEEWKGLALYAMDLIEHDLLVLPFDRCVFSWINKSVDERHNIAACRAAESNEPEPHRCLEFWLFMSDPGRHGTFTGFYTYIDLVLSKENGGITLQDPVPLGSLTPTAKEVSMERLSRVAAVMIQDFLSLLVMLGAANVEQRYKPAPDRLNKHRAKAGKPTIGELREVFVRVGDRVLRPSGEDTNRTHASPRMHWRRGHIRHLPSGELTTVKPALVGAVGGETPSPRGYRVKRAVEKETV